MLPAVEFEWDESKNLGNQRKHGVSFSEVRELFESEEYLEIFDEAHSEFEDRFIAIGPIRRGLVVVVHMEPEENVIRVISARRATRHERKFYLSFMDEKR